MRIRSPPNFENLSMKTDQLTLTEKQPPALVENPSTGSLIAAVIQSGITADNVEVIERLAALKEREEGRDAERQFNSAFVALQTDIPVIVASSVIPNRGKYERFEDVMEKVGPLLRRHGFSVSFEQSADDKRITVKCHLRHIAGHSSTTPFSVRLGGRADSETQADCKASTTAKRNSLLQALNIVIRQDIYQSDEADATIEGDTITEEQAATLQALVEETGADRRKFLAFAHACTTEEVQSRNYTFEAIPANRYAELVAQLEKRRK
jgi:hypothetical protein